MISYNPSLAWETFSPLEPWELHTTMNSSPCMALRGYAVCLATIQGGAVRKAQLQLKTWRNLNPSVLWLLWAELWRVTSSLIELQCLIACTLCYRESLAFVAKFAQALEVLQCEDWAKALGSLQCRAISVFHRSNGRPFCRWSEDGTMLFPMPNGISPTVIIVHSHVAFFPVDTRCSATTRLAVVDAHWEPSGRTVPLTAPTVRIFPGQAKQCVKPHLQEGQSATCTICIDVMTDDYAFDLLNPPTSFEIRESGNSGILSGAQQNVEWQNATHGSVCIIISVFASEVSTGSQAMNLVLGYTKFAQDCLLPGTLRSPLLNPVEPMYPWCLDSGDCTSTSVEGGVAILEIQEPPVGQPRFAESEHVFDEGSLGSLVLSREGGNYSALTTTVRINTTLSSAVAGVNYEFQDAVVSWPHLDSTPKSIAITFPDNNIFEANPSLTLHLVPSVQIGGQILLRIADNGDGGRLGFSSQRITRPETAPQSASCLVNVRQVSAEWS